MFLQSPCPVGAYEVATHDSLNQLGAQLVQQEDSDGLYAEVYLLAHQTQLRQGGVHEDDGIPTGFCGPARFMKHFYQPASGLGLLSPLGGRCIDAVTWARDSDDDLTWAGAIDTYDYTAASKAGDAGAYRRLGHVAHLVGDMAQPDHVHLEPRPFSDYESWVDENWGLVAPDISTLTPRQRNTMEAHLTEMANITYPASSFDGGTLNPDPDNPIGPNTEFARMFRVEYSIFWGQWDLYNWLAVDPNETYLGNWDGNYSNDDNFWETRAETGFGDPGYYTVEEIIDAIPAFYKGTTNTSRRPLGYFYATTLLPTAVEYIAGLYQHYYEIVNHPPYVYKVKISQAGRCIYEKHWEDTISDDSGPGGEGGDGGDGESGNPDGNPGGNGADGSQGNPGPTPPEGCDPTAVNLASFTATGNAGYVLLEWETASELDNAGFNVWRSEAVDGQYVKLNESLIPAQGDATTGASYSFTDTTVTGGVTYDYKLEDVDLRGCVKSPLTRNLGDWQGKCNS